MVCGASSHTSSVVLFLSLNSFLFSVSDTSSLELCAHICLVKQWCPHYHIMILSAEAFQILNFRQIVCQNLQVELRHARHRILKQAFNFQFIAATEEKHKNKTKTKYLSKPFHGLKYQDFMKLYLLILIYCSEVSVALECIRTICICCTP